MIYVIRVTHNVWVGGDYNGHNSTQTDKYYFYKLENAEKYAEDINKRNIQSWLDNPRTDIIEMILEDEIKS